MAVEKSLFIDLVLNKAPEKQASAIIIAFLQLIFLINVFISPTEIQSEL